MPVVLSVRAAPRRYLQLLVRLYRRRCSGRGPWRRVRCTFERLESCSSFGERALREAPGAAEAVLRILRRLARCRRLSLYRLAGGALAGGRGYRGDARALAARLARDGELAAVRDAVAVAACSLASGARDAGTLLVRDAARVRATLRRRAGVRALAGTALAGAAATAAAATSWWAVALACGAGAVVLSASALASWKFSGRLDALEVLAAVEEPLRR